jgi:predicted Zn-dependent peptidase
LSQILLLLLAANLVAQRPARPVPKPAPQAAKRSPDTLERNAPGKAPGVPTLGVAIGPGGLAAARPSTAKLANGIRVLVLGRQGLPTVHGLLRTPGGTAADPAEKTGLARAALAALRAGGTRELPGEALDQRLNRIGASIDTLVDVTGCGLRFQCLREDFDEVAGLLGSLIRFPAFDTDAVDAALGRIRTSVGLRNTAPATVALRHFRLLAHGMDGMVTRQTEYFHLDNIGIEDLRRFGQIGFQPGSMVVAVEGDLDPKSVVERLNNTFGGWTTPETAAPELKFPVMPAPGIYYSEQRQMRNVEFAIGHGAGVIGGPDYAALRVAAEILGGEVRSRLAAVSDEKRIWNLRATARWEAGFGHPGYFEIRGSVGAPFATDAIRECLEAVNALRRTPPEPAETEVARYRVLHAMAVGLARPGGALPGLVRRELDSSFTGHAPEVLWRAMQEVTPASIQTAAARHWRPKDFTIVIIGSQTLFDRPLDTLGYTVKPLDVSIPGPKPFESCTDAAQIEGGKALLARMADALGGARLSGVRSLEQKLQGRLRRGKAWTTISASEYWMAKDTFRQEVEADGLLDLYFYNGEIGWHGRASGIRPLPAHLVRRVRGNIFRYLFLLAQAGSDPNRNVCRQGERIVQVTDRGGNGVRIYMDGASALPLRLSYQSESANGVASTVEETLSDWREVDGIQWPHSVSLKENGRREQEYAVEKIVFNPKLDPAVLEQKP